MPNSPFFSVIIPTYNRAGFIRTTIESVLAQSFQDFEIIVIDDGSTDNTEAVVNEIKTDKLRYFKKENAERAAARNYGAQKAFGQFINFLDSDDLLYTHHLQSAHAFVRENSVVEIFHLGYDIKDDHVKLLRTVNNIKSINDEILSGNILSCNGVFIRKDIIVKNQFNEDRALSSLEDWELWIRMCARYRFLNGNVVTSTIIQHDERSVMAPNTSKIKQKADQFVKYVLADETNKARFGNKLNLTVASAWTYVALHLLMARANKKDVLRYLWNGVRLNPGEIMKKRFLVILKKLAGL